MSEPPAPSSEPQVELVIKIGGSILKSPDDLGRVLSAVASVSRERRLLVVPGGGLFADAVRAVDEQLGLSDDAAHWMAILAMDQCALVLAERLPGGVLVTDEREIASAIELGRIPVLAPSRWLRDADPLPHSWDVTSDSIAAWFAGAVGASRLVLLKPAGAAGAALVDAHFARALPEGVVSEIVPADRIETLASALSGR